MKNINKFLVGVFAFFSLSFSAVSPVRATLSCGYKYVGNNYVGNAGIGTVGENVDITFFALKSASDQILYRGIYVGSGGWVTPSSYGGSSTEVYIDHNYVYSQPNDYIAAAAWVYEDVSGVVKTQQCIYDRLRIFTKQIKNYGVLRLNYPSNSVSQTVIGSGSQVGVVGTSVFRGNNGGYVPYSGWNLYANNQGIGLGGQLVSDSWSAGSGDLGVFASIYPSELPSSVLVKIVLAGFGEGEGAGAYAEADLTNLIVFSRNPPISEPDPIPGLSFKKCEGRYFSETICKWRLRDRIAAGEGTCQLDPNLGKINSSGPNYWKWGFCSNGVEAVSTPAPTDVPMPTNTPIPTNTPRPTSTPTPRMISVPSGSCHGVYFGEWQCNDRAKTEFPGVNGTCQLNPELGALKPDGPNYWKWSYCEAIGGVATVPTSTPRPTNTPRPTSTPTPRAIGGTSTGTCHGQYFGEWQCKSRAEAQFPGINGTCQLNPKLGTIDPTGPNYWRWSYCE